MKDKVRKCIVKDSKIIRSLLEKRFKELDLYGIDIIRDAAKLKYSISEQALSRYRNSGNVKGSLSQEDILWLCCRYGINVSLESTEMVPYDEKKCLRNLKNIFK